MKRRRLFLLLIGFLVAGSLAGCATFRGLGEDIQTLGKKLENKASK
jgi:predicted small secreted protein